jgi:uncharacterized membrane protein
VFHSLSIAVHAAAAVAVLVVGFLALRAAKAPGRHPQLGGLYFALLLVALPSGMVVGAQNAGVSVFELVTPPTLAMGTVGYLAARRRPRRLLGQPWIVWHIGGQGGSYIGVVTATGFQFLPRVLPESLALTTSLWLVPTLVGTVLISRAVSATPARS